MRRQRFEWDWPPPGARFRSTPDAVASRPASWFDTPRGSMVAHAIFRFGILVWKTILFCVLMAMLVASLWLLVALIKGGTVNAHAEQGSDHVCHGLWTGNACLGTWSNNVDEHQSYQGETYVHDGKVRQRPERR